MIGHSCFLLVTFLAVVYCAAVVEVTDQEWADFKAKYNRQYEGDEDVSRRSMYMQKKEEVEAHNALYKKGDVSFEIEINHFADLTPEEAQQQVCGSEMEKLISDYLADDSVEKIPVFVNSTIPATFDWREKGAVTPIKNQKMCGSCWAFSATGALEGQWKIKKGSLPSLSEQQLVDCDKIDKGCSGGLPMNAYKYITKAGGIESEQSYPYIAFGETCKFDKSKIVANDDNGKQLSKSEDVLKSGVYSIGPISVGIDASGSAFQSYKSGVYSKPNCGKNCNGLDHGVLVVGYGEENGKKYWIIKNSWGTQWGMQGYMFMARDAGNMCGITCMATYPTVE